MKKLLLILLALPVFGFAQTTDLIISEYGEGAGGSKKYIEIYNGTGASVNLDDYQLWRSTNGGGWNVTPISFTAGTTLLDGESFVIANNATDVPGADQYNTSVQHNGDDATGLAKNIASVWTLIDQFGDPDADPGTGWAVDGVTNATVDNIIVRKNTVCSPSTDWATTSAAGGQWVIALTDGDGTAGYNSTTDPVITMGVHTTNCTVGCNLTASGLTALTCNDNSTPSVTTDDYLTFTLNPTGSNLGSTYSVSVSSGTITPTSFAYGSATSFQLQNGSAGAGNVTVTITDNATGTCTIDQIITDPGACSTTTPVVNGTPATLTGFDHLVGTPSTSQTISVSGNGLTADITVTAPANFEVSLDNTAFSASVNLTQTAGSVAATDVYVRGNGSAYGAITGNVVVSSAGATSVNIAVDGFVNDYITYTINQVDNTDANGLADSLDVLVRLNGVIHCQDFDGNAGYSFTMIDGSGEGINVFSTTDKDGYTNPASGDSIWVKGKIAMYNGLLEVMVDSIGLISSGAVLETPAVVTTLDETTESQYITLENLTFVTPMATFPTTNTNIDVTDGTNTFVLRIMSSTDLNGAPAPQGPFNVTGLGGQFDNSNPYTSGYQLFPCGTSSFEPVCTGVNLPNTDVTWIGDGLEANATGAGITYQWYDCDLNDDIDGETAQQYYPDVNGNYAVIVSNGTCSDTSDCVDFMFWNVNELDLTKLISLYPNPANEFVTISNKSNLDLAIEVIDLTGKVCFETSSKNTSISVNVNSLNNGVYIVNIVSASGILQERVIVQK